MNFSPGLERLDENFLTFLLSTDESCCFTLLQILFVLSSHSILKLGAKEKKKSAAMLVLLHANMSPLQIKGRCPMMLRKSFIH